MDHPSKKSTNKKIKTTSADKTTPKHVAEEPKENLVAEPGWDYIERPLNVNSEGEGRKAIYKWLPARP